jgi:hypothetical protein
MVPPDKSVYEHRVHIMLRPDVSRQIGLLYSS